MNEVIITKEVPDTWKEANITIIPKEETDTKDPKIYRPISLLNTDYKIFAKILLERLKEFLKSFVNEDQAGFLPGRQIRDDLRVLLDAVEYYDKKIGKKVAFLFLDAEKAFDNVNWGFMNILIKKMKLGDNFSNAVQVIYSEQKASIIINNEISKNIKIQKPDKVARSPRYCLSWCWKYF